jgi:CheY-like chemotaxis protein
VRDTGPGISKSDQAALFEQFERGAAEREGRESGAGLGLAMARRLVAAMGGEIGVESRLGHGAEFWFELPLPVSARAHDAPLRGERFAIAAPQDVLRSALADQIRALGGEALEIDSPHCLRAAAGRELLLDSAWADQAGASGAARAWILVGAAEKKPLIAALPDGVEGWLVKPVRRESLIERVSQPLAETAEIARPAEMPLQPADQGRLSGLRVLLAEDDPVNALIARKLLADMGAEVEWADSGAAAYKALEEARRSGRLPDAALVDQRMPEMDGPDLARKARAAGFGLPLIALTANDTETDRRLCHEAGMNAFLSKPVDREQLAVTLEQLCGKQNRASLA